MHDVTRIDEAESHPTADRRRDAAIIELEPSVVDLSLIDLDSAFILTHERLLGVELLLGDRILLIENVIAFEIDLGVLKLCLIFRHLAFGLRQLHLKRAWIDFREKRSRRDDIAFAKQDSHELAIDPAFHGNHVERRHRPQSGQIDVHFAGLGLCGHHRNGTRGGILTLPCGRRIRFAGLHKKDIDSDSQKSHA